MTVTASSTPAVNSLPPTSPRYPFATFAQELEATGDASGGAVRLQLVFASAGAPAGPVVGIHSLTAERVDSVAEPVEIATQGFTLGGAGDQDLRLLLETQDSGIIVGTQLIRYGRWLLGHRRPEASGATHIEATWRTNTNTITYHFYISGYLWPRTVLQQQGGPLWPGEHELQTDVEGQAGFYARLRSGQVTELAPARSGLRPGVSLRLD